LAIPVWSKNSSSLPASKIFKFFNADEFRDGAREPLQCDRFVIENITTDRIHRIYRLNRIEKTLAFSKETGKPEVNQALSISGNFRLLISGPQVRPLYGPPIKTFKNKYLWLFLFENTFSRKNL
jgi:hypothetical protein